MSHSRLRSTWTIVVIAFAFSWVHAPDALSQDELVIHTGGSPFVVEPVTLTEGDGSTIANAEIKVSLRQTLPQHLTVPFTNLNGTATGGSCGTAGADYATTSGELKFEASTSGLTTGSSLVVTIPLCGDDLREGNEQFTLRLSSTLSLVNVFGAVTIADNEPLPTISITPAVQVKEPSSGQAPAVFTVSVRGLRTAQTITVHVATSPRTASAGTRCAATLPTDYVTQSRTLTFSRNDTAGLATQIPTVRTQQVEVAVCGKRVAKDPEEIFFVTLSSPVNAVLDDTASKGAATILP
jgi:hypothetical protein